MFISVYMCRVPVYIVVECRRFILQTLHHIGSTRWNEEIAWLGCYTTKTRIYIMGEVNSSTIIIYYGAMLDGYTELDAEAREMAQAPPAWWVHTAYILYNIVYLYLTYAQLENGGNYN